MSLFALLLENPVHLLTPDSYDVSTKIKCGRGLCHDFDDHQAILMPSSNTFHQASRTQRLLVRDIQELRYINTGGATGCGGQRQRLAHVRLLLK